ncbi:hypothetical protein VUR80DRAFT_10109 [Thermomyces stellatus]
MAGPRGILAFPDRAVSSRALNGALDHHSASHPQRSFIPWYIAFGICLDSNTLSVQETTSPQCSLFPRFGKLCHPAPDTQKKRRRAPCDSRSTYCRILLLTHGGKSRRHDNCNVTSLLPPPTYQFILPRCCTTPDTISQSSTSPFFPPPPELQFLARRHTAASPRGRPKGGGNSRAKRRVKRLTFPVAVSSSCFQLCSRGR